MLKRLPRSSTWQRVVLDERETGYQAAPLEYKLLEGKSGRTLTDLRPAGTAEVDGQRVSVTTEGDFLEKNTEVEVIEVEGIRIVVRRIASA